MPATIKPRRGSGAPGATSSGELIVDTTNNRVLIGTGSTTSKIVGAAAHGGSTGVVQFLGTTTGALLSSPRFSISWDGSLVTSVNIGAAGQSEIPLNFALNNNAQTVSVLAFQAPTTVTVPTGTTYSTLTGTNNTITYILPNNLPAGMGFSAREFWGLRATGYNTSTKQISLQWANSCNVCPQILIDSETTSGPTQGGVYGNILYAAQFATDDDQDALLKVATAPNGAFRYDDTTNAIITPKIQASDTIESTGLVLKTGNTGKVKFVAESFAGSEVTVTVPSAASGGNVITTNSKISDLTADSWSNFATKLSSGKQGSGDVVLKTNATLTTPTIETSLTLSGANPQIKASTASANCDIFSDSITGTVTLGGLATEVQIGQKSGTVKLTSETILLAPNIFSIGGLLTPTTDTNKDKGIKFNWHNGTSAKIGFFGFDDSSGSFTFIPDATISSDVVSGTIGSINAQIEWANIQSVPAFATSSNNLSYFASTTSSQLAGVISDETGSGALVFGTSPSFTTGINAASTTMALFNTTATTINFGSAATTMNVGHSTGTVYFANNVEVNNEFFAKTKHFVIDHPSKPGKKLKYACLEGPENGVYVRGELKNENTIELPEYWVNLVDKDSITVNLTGIGKAGYHTVKEIKDNKITVEGSTGFINCYYVVYGERKDVSKLVTEFE